MAFFDTFSKKVGETTNDASQKLKDTQETFKLNSNITAEETAIKTCYQTIGQIYYEQYGDEPGEAFAEQVALVRSSMQKIEEYKARIRELKGVELCTNCGAELPKGTVFCSACGAKIVKMQPKPAEGTVCAKCGAALAPGTKFCTSCGTPVTAAAPAPAPAAAPAAEESAAESASEPEPIAEEPAPVAEEPQATVMEEPTPVAEPATEEPAPTQSIPDPAPAQTPAFIFCTECGTRLAYGTRFCTNCGTKVE